MLVTRRHLLRRRGLAKAEALVRQYSAPPDKIAQTVPVPKAPPKGKTIVFIGQGSDPAVETIGQGIKAAAQAVGWNYAEIDFTPGNPASLASAMTSALAKHPVAVSAVGQDPGTFEHSVVAAYAKAGVPIIISNASTFASSKVFVGDPGGVSSYQLAGKVLGAWVVADSKGKANVIAAHQPVYPALNAWLTGFQQEVSATCPGCHVKVLNSTVAQGVNGQESSAVVADLRRSPGYTYVMWDDGAWASGFTSALSAAGLTGIKVGGSDFTAEQAAALKNGTQAVWTGFNVKEVGYGVVDQAVRYVENVPVTSNDNTLPTELITKNNVGNQTTFVAPADALQQYEKLWKVSSGAMTLVLTQRLHSDLTGAGDHE